MKNLYNERKFEGSDPEETISCAVCGSDLREGERAYERDGIPYCRNCLLDAPGSELIRICEKGETAFFRGLGFLSRGRLPDGSL